MCFLLTFIFAGKIIIPTVFYHSEKIFGGQNCPFLQM